MRRMISENERKPLEYISLGNENRVTVQKFQAVQDLQTGVIYAGTVYVPAINNLKDNNGVSFFQDFTDSIVVPEGVTNVSKLGMQVGGFLIFTVKYTTPEQIAANGTICSFNGYVADSQYEFGYEVDAEGLKTATIAANSSDIKTYGAIGANGTVTIHSMIKVVVPEPEEEEEE